MTDANQQLSQIDAKTKKLFELGAHLGHKKNRLHPKSRRYIYKIVNGVSIIDLTGTVQQLEKAKKILTQYSSEGKNILIVATKKVAAQYTAEISKEHQIPAITSKWYGGLIHLEKRPDFLLIVDTKKEKNAVTEARMYNLPIIALSDTNTNPELVNFPIVINDDSAEVVHYTIKELVDAYVKGKKKA